MKCKYLHPPLTAIVVEKCNSLSFVLSTPPMLKNVGLFSNEDFCARTIRSVWPPIRTSSMAATTTIYRRQQQAIMLQLSAARRHGHPECDDRFVFGPQRTRAHTQTNTNTRSQCAAALSLVTRNVPNRTPYICARIVWVCSIQMRCRIVAGGREDGFREGVEGFG